MHLQVGGGHHAGKKEGDRLEDVKVIWRQVPKTIGRGHFGARLAFAPDGKLFITTMKGELVIARASPKAYEEIGRTTVIGTTRQAPAISNGLLYLRDDKEIVCLDVKNG